MSQQKNINLENLQSYHKILQEEYFAPIEKDIKINKIKIENLAYGFSPDPFETDDSIAYMKNVPSGALPYAELSKVGGMAYKSKNLIPFPYSDMMQSDGSLSYTKTINGVTFTVHADGSIHAKGTTTDVSANYYLCKGIVFADASVWGSGSDTGITYGGRTYRQVNFFKSSINSCYIEVGANKTVDKTYYPMINEGDTALPYELYYEGIKEAKVTKVISQGKNLAKSSSTGTVVVGELSIIRTENSAKFILNGTSTANKSGTVLSGIFLPQGTYCASTYGLVSADRLILLHGDSTVLVNYIQTGSSKTFKVEPKEGLTIRAQIVTNNGSAYSNTECGLQIERVNSLSDTASAFVEYQGEISSIEIPEAVQELGDYGYGIDAEYCNYIDLEKKQYIQRVCKYVVTGEENISIISPSDGKPYYKFIISSVNNDYLAISDKYNVNLISNHYMASGRNTVYNQQTNNIISIFQHSSGVNWVEISTDSQTTKEDMKAQLKDWYNNGNPLTVVYKLAEPIVTDISEYLPDDNFIKVEKSGYIIAENENKNKAPSSIIYMVKEEL